MPGILYNFMGGKCYLCILFRHQHKNIVDLIKEIERICSKISTNLVHILEKGLFLVCKYMQIRQRI